MTQAMRETILISGGRVYDHDGDVDMPAAADLVIADGAIHSVTPCASDGRPPAPPPGKRFDRIIDARDKLLLPGFFNAHYHSHDTLLKGCFETLTLDVWGLLAMPPAYERRSKEELRLRTIVGAIECIRTGITTVQDMDTLYPFEEEDLDVVLEAYDEIGLRCLFAPQFGNVGRAHSRAYYDTMLDEKDWWRLRGKTPQFSDPTQIIPRIEAAIKARRGKHPLVDFAIGPLSPEGVTRELLEQISDLSARENLPVYTHLYENKGMTLIARTKYAQHGGSLVRMMGDVGLLSPRTTFAHSVWLTRDEIALLGETGTNVALNPVGNLKTRSGVAPVRAFMEAGVNMGIGCDNCSCSDVQNMFQSMKMFTLLAGICDPEEGPPAAFDALHAATLGGAKTAGRTDLGALRPGMRADLSIIDLTDVSYVPLNSVARQVVYTESGRGVETVLVDGRVVMLDRKLTTIDEAAVRAATAEVMPALLKDLEAIKERLAPIMGQLSAIERKTWETDIGVERYVSARF